jgi:hypothetical protein
LASSDTNIPGSLVRYAHNCPLVPDPDSISVGPARLPPNRNSSGVAEGPWTSLEALMGQSDEALAELPPTLWVQASPSPSRQTTNACAAPCSRPLFRPRTNAGGLPRRATAIITKSSTENPIHCHTSEGFDWFPTGCTRSSPSHVFALSLRCDAGP